MRTIFAFLMLVFISFSNFSYGQSGYHWSENFGNKSVLLSGTVNASVEDLGAVFYNPGRLGLIENPAFVISAKVYEWRKLSVENGVDEGVDLNTDTFGGAPNLVAGTFRLPFLKGHRFAYSFLTRNRDKIDFYVRVEKEGDVVESLPGQELFNGKFNFISDFSDEWIGLTWNPPTSKSLSFGLSTFVSGLRKSTLVGVDMNAINEDNKSAYYSQNRMYSYDSYGVLWKAGLAWQLEKLSLGLTLTTPRINITGKGSTLMEDYLIGIDTTGDGNDNDIFIFNQQDVSSVQYKSPWAIGFGVGIPFNKGIIHLSGEWYSSIPNYKIMEIQPFIGQSSGDTIRFSLSDELQSVLNFGIGGEMRFSEKVTAYASIATDFTAVPNEVTRFSELENATSNSVLQADFIQFGGGLSILTKALELTIGATYKGASQEFEQTIDFPPNDSEVNSTFNFSQWRFIVGFSFPFTDKLKNAVEGDG